MNVAAFGFESIVGSNDPAVHWQPSREAREEVIEELARSLRSNATNTKVLARRVVKLEDGSVYVEVGAPALHVQWRRTRFRSEHYQYLTYQDQVALVDVISGRVVIVDRMNEFKPAQHVEWSKSPCLQEHCTSGGHPRSFWPAVRPAVPGENCHYMVVNAADLDTLKTRSQPDDQVDIAGPFKVPAFA